MASLTNTKIKDTYDGLLKTTDNDALGGTYKLITDGLGNSSGLYLGTGERLGIGASSPASELTVNGQIEASSNTTTPSGGNAYFYKSSAGAVVSGYSTIIETGGLGSRTEKLRVDNSGNVGINTSSPSNGKLQIDSTGNQISIETGTSGDGRLHIGHFSNGTFIGTYGDDGGAADVIRFGTHSGDERMRIDSSGNVGIGTSSPSYRLQVDGRVQVENDIINIVDSTPTVLFSVPGGGLDSMIKNDGSGNLIFGNGTNSATPTERLRIDSSGNVGIGTSSPSYPLSIRSSGDGIKFEVSDNVDANCLIEVDGTDIKFGPSTSSDLVLMTSFSERMRIDSSGNVGIGVSSPSMKMHINGDTSAMTQVGISNTSTGEARIYFDASNGDFSGNDYFSIGQQNDLNGIIDLAPSGFEDTYKRKRTSTHYE